jgi:hypothetical protein
MLPESRENVPRARLNLEIFITRAANQGAARDQNGRTDSAGAERSSFAAADAIFGGASGDSHGRRMSGASNRLTVGARETKQ